MSHDGRLRARLAAPGCLLVAAVLTVAVVFESAATGARDDGVTGRAGAPGQVAAAPRPPAWRPDVAAARAYARRRRGIVAFAVRTPGRAWSFRGTRSERSASVVKVMLMAAYLRSPAVRGRALTAGDRELLGPMITVSDNPAANRVLAAVGTRGLAAVARRARMRAFVPATVWGTSRITASDQTRLMLLIERVLPRRHRRYAMGLLAGISSSQRWGVADARPPGWRLYFKSGWSPAPPAVEHQVALLRRGSRRVALAILTTGLAAGAYARETQRGVGTRLLRGL